MKIIAIPFGDPQYNGYRDIVGEYLGNIEFPSYELGDTSDFYNYIDNYGNYKISFLGIDINTIDVSIPILSVIIGILDGVNISGLCMLIFIISLLININDKRSKWLWGLIIIGIFTLIDLLFINVNVNFNKIKIIFGVFIIGISLLYLMFKKKDNIGEGNKYALFDNKSKLLLIIISIINRGLVKGGVNTCQRQSYAMVNL